MRETTTITAWENDEMAKQKVKHLTGVLASVFAHAGHISKEDAREMSALADHEFEMAYNKASDITEKVMQAEGDKMEMFLQHLAEEIDAHMEAFGGKMFH
jgi:hypothetical protein